MTRRNHSFSARLMLGLLVLVLMTTLSAGVPAYWLTRTQLERQAWLTVDGAQRATLSLLLAERDRLVDLVALLAERPTLQRLARVQSAELAPYLEAFRTQSTLDLLLVCGPDGRMLAGDAVLQPACGAPGTAGFDVLDGQPAAVAAVTLDDAAGVELGTAVAARVLDNAFLQQLARNTGAEQNILRTDGTRLRSSHLPPDAQVTRTARDARSTAVQDSQSPIQNSQFSTSDGRFYAAELPLPGRGEVVALHSEVALPVDDLLATESRARTILAASTGLVALLAVALGVWYLRQLNAPLRQLTRVAERISQGDLLTPVPQLSGPVEVTTLAAALQKSQASMLQALDELAQARDWLNNLVQSIVEGVVTFDVDGRVTFLSLGAERLLGWPAAEGVGRNVAELFRLDGLDTTSVLDRLPPPGSKRQLETRTRTGRPITLAVTGARLVPPDADTVQVALVLRDVTEEEALRNLRSYFLANISHEFRTPLSTLMASIELLMDEREELSTDEMRELLRPTYLSVLGLQTLIDNLLESSRIEAGQFAVRKRPLSLNPILSDALRVVHPLLERRRQTLSVVEPTALPPVLADPARILQVLINLLTNASKYSPIGTAVELSVTQHGPALRISIADRGPGIPPDDRDNLFRRFVRLDTQDSEQYGIGLGLYVVKTSVEAHGGQVGVEDRPGGGSVFWFELPLAQVESA